MNILFKVLTGLNSVDVPEVKPLTLRNVGTSSASVSITQTGSPTVDGLQYRMEGENGWQPYTIDTEITLSADEAVQFQNTNETLSTSINDYVKFVMTGEIEGSGNIQSMLNYIENCTDYCYRYMFFNCSSLTSAPELPATTLATQCYSIMFNGCSSLTSAPELPATTLADVCYASMFYGCKGLTSAPELPATTLVASCYSNMFRECSSLTTAPELPATTLGTSCYYGMFQNCSSLTSAPELPATTLADYCYASMFYGCKGLTSAPELPATTLAMNCYSNMFRYCSSLTDIKVGFAEWHTNATYGWVASVVPSGGTFYKPSALPEEFGISRIPNGWTVVNID